MTASPPDVGRLIDQAFPTRREAAERLGVSPQSISKWCVTGHVPAHRAPDLERVTRGAIRRDQVRPDLYGPLPCTPNYRAPRGRVNAQEPAA